MTPWKNSCWQWLVKWALWVVGTLYILIEKLRDYPNEERDNILGLPIDEDLRDKTRFELCSYMDSGFPRDGFWDLNSTTKIRLGAQLMRNLTSKPKAGSNKKSPIKKKKGVRPYQNDSLPKSQKSKTRKSRK